MSEATVWVSGEFVAARAARVPATSRTVTLGVGLYETLRVTRGRAPLLPLHLERLAASARAAGLSLGDLDWRAAVEELARRNGLSEARARITLGDGFALITCAALPSELARERSSGIALPARVWERPCAATKSTSRFDLESLEREEKGEVLLVTRGGAALETTRANFFAATPQGLLTAAAPAVLPGIGRRLVLDLARELGLSVQERAPALEELDTWQEAFATSALRGVRPVSAVAGRDLREPRGPVTRRLQAALEERWGLC